MKKLLFIFLASFVFLSCKNEEKPVHTANITIDQTRGALITANLMPMNEIAEDYQKWQTEGSRSNSQTLSKTIQPNQPFGLYIQGSEYARINIQFEVTGLSTIEMGTIIDIPHADILILHSNGNVPLSREIEKMFSGISGLFVARADYAALPG